MSEIILKSLALMLMPITEKVKDKIIGIVSNLRSEAQAKELVDSIGTQYDIVMTERLADRYLRFRTLQSPKAKIYINEIYHPLVLSFSEEKKELRIENETTLPTKNILVVVGKAGQGKTTTLRKLVYNELMHGESIPIIIFLREIEWCNYSSIYELKENTPEIIRMELDRIGIYVRVDVIFYLLEKKLIKIFFDGFDEVPHDFRAFAQQLIHTVYLRYNSPCIVTTRPGTEISTSSGNTEIVDLKDLKESDVQEMIKRNCITDDSGYIDSLLLRVNNADFSGLLKTPILVDIFLSVYAALKKDPENLSDFYKDLFILLSDTHDRFKSSLQRSSFSGLTNHQLRDVFLSTCAGILQKNSMLTFTESELIDFFTIGCKMSEVNDKSGKIHSDIIDKTSLIIVDGITYSFIHKTILEYHASEYIRTRLSEVNKNNVYKKFAEKGVGVWEQALTFLSETDRDSFLIYYCSAVLNNLNIGKRTVEEIESATIEKELLHILLGYSHVRFYFNENNYSLPIEACGLMISPNEHLYSSFYSMFNILSKRIPSFIEHSESKEFFKHLSNYWVDDRIKTNENKELVPIISFELERYREHKIPYTSGSKCFVTYSDSNNTRKEDHCLYHDYKVEDIIGVLTYSHEPAAVELRRIIEVVEVEIKKSLGRVDAANYFSFGMLE